ncbi:MULTISPECIES: hypothetical protein [Microbacterium]|uniref:hypothetical protein n=1 Tax=Microbacterium TaxID=33882 RepID=UPI001470854C|nr:MULTISPECIES: hypothetical protein [Microbacterium]MDR7187303.1 hypothetical protein [Microbacterium sp. BE35]
MYVTRSARGVSVGLITFRVIPKGMPHILSSRAGATAISPLDGVPAAGALFIS